MPGSSRGENSIRMTSPTTISSVMPNPNTGATIAASRAAGEPRDWGLARPGAGSGREN